MTLNGVDTVANYQQVLRTVQYQNTAASTNFTDRTIEFVVKDTGVFNTESEVAKTVVQLLPPNHVLLEAENLNLETYRVEDNSFASGEKLISLRDAVGTMGTASTQLTGETGTYDITVGYLDESDGNAKLELQVDGSLIDLWSLDKTLGSADPVEQTFIERRIKGVFLDAGASLTLVGHRTVANGPGGTFCESLPRFPAYSKT